MDNIAAFVNKRYKQWDSNSANWKHIWDVCAKYGVPNKDNVYGNNTPGDPKHSHLFDSTALNSIDELAAGLGTIMTNPSSDWFLMTTGDTELDNDHEVALFLSETAKRMLRRLASSNFYTMSHEETIDSISFGTGVLFQDFDEDGPYFTAFAPYDWRIRTDHRGRVVGCARKYKLSLEAIYEEFGDESFDDDMKDMLVNAPDRKFEIVHMIDKREVFERVGKLKTLNKNPYTSIHVLIDKKIQLKLSGYKEFPASFSRWSKSSCEDWGRGPLMKALPDIMTANQQVKTQLQAGQFRMAPPLQATENALLNPVNYTPFGITFRKPGSDPLQPLFPAGAVGVEAGEVMVERSTKTIERHFFIPQLRTIENDRMTATEVVQRRDEQYRSLGSVLTRISQEKHEPHINRLFRWMLEKGELPEAPEKLAQVGGELKIRYTSMIARAQIIGDGESVMRLLQEIGPLVPSQPEIMDNFDGDEMLKTRAIELGVNLRYLKKPNKVKEIRTARAEAQKQQADMEQANAGAEVINKTSGAMNEQQTI